MVHSRSRNARRAHFRRVAVVALFTACAIAGCASPQARYRVLSFFFDGVPDPDDEARRAAEAEADRADESGRAGGGSTHQPVVEGRCRVCHGFERPTAGRSLAGPVSRDAIDRAWFACVECHGMMTSEPGAAIVQRADLWLHGPVAVGECRACHVGHRSPYPSLLRSRRAEQDCLPCHAELGERGGAMAVLDCVECHDPHSAARAADLLLHGGIAGNCAQCHTRTEEEPRWLHGPVAKGNCAACHDAHGGASSPRHVRRPLRQACAACHEDQDLAQACIEDERSGAGAVECDQCHDPHAAESASEMFLRDRAGEPTGRSFRPARKDDGAAR